MRNWKKVLTAIVLTLAVMVFGIGAASTSASASKWHKGIPSIVKKHKVWVNPKKSVSLRFCIPVLVSKTLISTKPRSKPYQKMDV